MGLSELTFYWLSIIFCLYMNIGSTLQETILFFFIFLKTIPLKGCTHRGTEGLRWLLMSRCIDASKGLIGLLR